MRQPASARPSAAPTTTAAQRPQGGGFATRPAFPQRPAAAPSRPAATPPLRPAPAGASAPRPAAGPAPAADTPLPADFKDRFLAEVQRANRTFYNLHVATAQKIDLDGGRVVFTFGPVHETMRQQVEARRPWLEERAESVAGRRVVVTTARGSASEPTAPRPATTTEPAAPAPAPPDADLKARALADGGVKAMLEVFPAEIREVEEIK